MPLADLNRYVPERTGGFIQLSSNDLCISELTQNTQYGFHENRELALPTQDRQDRETYA